MPELSQIYLSFYKRLKPNFYISKNYERKLSQFEFLAQYFRVAK
jgi:hypothetical protein